MSVRLSKLEQVDEKSEYVKDFISAKSAWFIRSGIYLMALVTAALLTISCLVEYPDKITTQITITTLSPPLNVVTQASGNLLLTVQENQVVSKGQTLAYVANSANSAAVMQLKQAVQQADLSQRPAPALQTLLQFQRQQLGEIYKDYSELIISAKNVVLFDDITRLDQQARLLELEVTKYQAFLRKRQHQIGLLTAETQLVQRDYSRNVQLFGKGVIASAQLEVKERELLQAKEALQTASLSFSETDIRLVEIQKALNDIAVQNQQRKQELSATLLEAQKKLLGQIALWEQKYVLTSPMAGRVAFFKFWSNSQFATQGESVFTVLPANSTDIIGKVIMPALNSAKVRVGQKVVIKLNDYQYREFGQVKGVVESISLIPKNQEYSIQVHLPEKLLTTYKKKLAFRTEMQGSAEIITEDLRLIERIYYQFRGLFMA
ncbi:HlyD family secretion protein [Hymenobacter sp. BT635]|uniref:HlyD family secretion protein n=1 Tax=Hymenobacter nitidus TaxID=2880929 RepID=A0ABS8AG12_9BACT|nr:HlyD family efflux transporter periplasmic adaptor subunit [Hymenobacter nitidus]MCB2378642.1 HlyD family secretion protein [Hymenobacter nitidus]